MRSVNKMCEELRRVWNDRRLRRIILWLLAACFALLFISLSCFYPLFVQSSSLWSTVPARTLCPVFAIGVILGAIAWGTFRSHAPTGKAAGEILDPFRERTIRMLFLRAFMFASLLSFATLFVYIWVVTGHDLLSVVKGFASFLVRDQGGMFALVTGALTLIGTYIALHSIVELRHTITSFSQMIRRITHLIEEAREADEEVCFFAYTPLPGAFNMHVGSGLIKSLINRLLEKDTRINLVCLDKSAHERWLQGFPSHSWNGGDRSRVDEWQGIRDRFSKECEHIIDYVGGRAYKRRKVANEEAHQKSVPCKHVVRLPWRAMPGFYFAAHRNRAIVGIPVAMHRTGNPSPLGGGVGVDTLGFETTDDRVVQMLLREFNRYKSPEFVEDDICDVPAFVTALSAGSRHIDQFLWNLMDQSTQAAVREDSADQDPVKIERAERRIIGTCNNWMLKADEFDQRLVEQLSPSQTTRDLRAKYEEEKDKDDLRWLLRLVIQDAYPQNIAPRWYSGTAHMADIFEWTPSDGNFVMS